MTGDGTCGVFIPGGVVVGEWHSQWEGASHRVHNSDPTRTPIQGVTGGKDQTSGGCSLC